MQLHGLGLVFSHHFRSMRLTIRSKMTGILEYLNKKVIATLIFSIVSGIAETLSILVIGPFLAFATSYLSQNSNENNQLGQGERIIREILSKFGFEATFKNATIMIAAALLIRGTIVYYIQAYNAKTRTAFAASVKKRIVDTLASAQYSNIAKLPIGYYLDLLTSKVDSLNLATKYASVAVSQITMIAIYVVAGVVLSPTLFLYFILTGVPMVIVFNAVNKRISSISNQITYVQSDQTHIFSSMMSNIKYLRASGYEDNEKARISRLTNKISNLYENREKLLNLIGSFKEIFIIFLLLGVILVELTRSKDSSLAIITILIIYKASSLAIGAQASLQTVFENYGSILFIKQTLAQIRGLPDKKTVTFKRLPDKITKIHLNNVISSPSNDQKINASACNNIEFVRSELTAIVGASGSGKSSLINTILGIHHVVAGEIVVNENILLRDLNQQEFNKKIGYLSQRIVILDGSIEYNIALQESSIDHKRLIHAAKMACCDDFIQELPNKYKTVVTHGFDKLSGGQMQRIAIARELYKQPDIFIFDEPTSALDETNRGLINSLMATIKQTSIVICATHDTFLIESADKIVLLKNNNAVESVAEEPSVL
jgi:ABC-type bacteriocin/lantibiotic exporter with double-glycine peptidase domain